MHQEETFGTSINIYNVYSIVLPFICTKFITVHCCLSSSQLLGHLNWILTVLLGCFVEIVQFILGKLFTG